MDTTIARKEDRFRGQRWSWYEAGQGPAMVWLHGGGGTGKDWWYQLERFARSWRVIAPDLPGFGRSDFIPGIEEVPALAPAVLDWLKEVDAVPAVLGGNSMGGRIALFAAGANPSAVRRLILLDAAGIHLPGIPIVNPLTLPPAKFIEGLVRDPVGFRRKTPYRNLDDLAELSRGRTSFARYSAHDRADGPVPDFARITMPTLIVWGREDRIIPAPYAEELTRRLPDSRLVWLDTGHLPHMEAPEETSAAVAAFLDETSAPSDADGRKTASPGRMS